MYAFGTAIPQTRHDYGTAVPGTHLTTTSGARMVVICCLCDVQVGEVPCRPDRSGENTHTCCPKCFARELEKFEVKIRPPTCKNGRRNRPIIPLR